MGRAELELVQRAIGLYNAREVEALAELCDPEIEVQSIYAGIEAGGLFRTPEGFPRAYFHELDQAWSSFELVDPSYEDFGSVVLVTCHMRGVGRHSQVEVETPVGIVWRVRDGRLWIERSLTDHEEARALAREWSATDGPRARVRLYRAPFSTNVERVALALAHKGIEAESVVIDYSDRSPVERVSGQGLVPVIEHRGQVVNDSTAILRYLELRWPDPPLWPAGEAARAEVDLFVEWFNEVWKGPPNEIEAELSSGSPDADRVASLSGLMDGWLDRFESLLAGRDHLMGAELSVADCIAFPFLKYARGRDPEDDELFHRVLDEHQSLATRPRLAAWVDRVDARPRV